MSKYEIADLLLETVDFNTSFSELQFPPTPEPESQHVDILQQALDSAIDISDLEDCLSPLASPLIIPSSPIRPQPSRPSGIIPSSPIHAQPSKRMRRDSSLSIPIPRGSISPCVLTPESSECSTPLSATSITSQSPANENRGNDSLTFIFPDPSILGCYTQSPDLQKVLMAECHDKFMPFNLLTSLAPSHTPKNDATVFQRERSLYARFESLEKESNENVKGLREMYKYQSATIETERYQKLMKPGNTEASKKAINTHYDNELSHIIERVEKSLGLMERYKAPAMYRSTTKLPKPRPLLSRQAVAIMEEWYQQNVEHPYPVGATVDALAIAGSISGEQVKKWFANKRNRACNTKTLTEIAKVKRKRSFFY